MIPGRLAHVSYSENKKNYSGRGALIYCADYRSHSIAISGDPWPDDLRISDIEPRFVCTACSKRGADARPDFNWERQPRAMIGYR
jgi:hypothetical protein